MQCNGPDNRSSLSDVLGPVLNFSVAIFGAGWIVMPLTATQMGLVIPCLSILGVGLLNAYACTALLRAAEELGAPESYHELTEKVLGRKWALLLDFFVALASTLSCAQRLILVGDYGVALKHRLITRRYQPVRPLIVLLLIAALAVPLAYSRALRKVEKVSALSMLCILVAFGITIYTLADMIAGDGLPTGEIKYANWSPNLLLAFPTQVFAYAGQQAILPIYRELRNRSLERAN
jgi:amino acid permease